MNTGWAASTVGEQFDVQLGKMLDAAKNSGEPKPYLGNRAVQWGRIDLSAIALVPLTQSDIRRFRLRAGDLLVCEGGEVGRAAIWHDELQECYYQKALHRLRPRSGYDARLMQALLGYWSSNGTFSNYVTQTSIAHLPREKLIQMPLPLPSAAEQGKIGDVLQDADSLIATIERRIAKKQAIKQGLMQRLLTGRTRLPGFSSQWIKVALGEVATLQRGFDLPTRLRRRGDVPIVSSAGPSGWHDRAMVKAPGVITGRYGTIGEVFFETNDFWPLNTTLWVSDFHGNDARFIYYLLQRIDFATHSGKSGVPGVNRNDLHSETVRLPDSVAEQQAIVTSLDDVEQEFSKLQDRLTKARNVKTGVMQQLLTGRTRLPVPEPAA